MNCQVEELRREGTDAADREEGPAVGDSRPEGRITQRLLDGRGSPDEVSNLHRCHWAPYWLAFLPSPYATEPRGKPTPPVF